MQSATADPTLPIVFSFGYSVYSFVRKRKLRSPEGPFFGDNPLWGSLASSLGALALSGVVRLLSGPTSTCCRSFALGLSHRLRPILWLVGTACVV